MSTCIISHTSNKKSARLELCLGGLLESGGHSPKMPDPNEFTDKDSFLNTCIGEVISEGTGKDQAVAVCNSMWENKSNTKETTHQYTFSPISVKEEDGEFYSEGFIATTHPDRVQDSKKGCVGEILSVDVLKQIVKFINDGVATIKGIGSTRTVSKQHDWITHKDASMEPAGMAVPPAELREMDGGNFGVFVKTHHNKEHPDYESIIYRVKNGYYPGYSIEYEPDADSIVNHEGQRFRFIKSIKNFVGYAFASARKIANPMALISSFSYKEIEEKANDEDKPLNKPFRLPKGSSKKFGVYVKDGDKIKKVTFGDPDMEIRRDDEEARKSFRARHKCDQQTDKTSAAYWSCRMWEKDATVSESTKEIKEDSTMDNNDDTFVKNEAIQNEANIESKEMEKPQKDGDAKPSEDKKEKKYDKKSILSKMKKGEKLDEEEMKMVEEYMSEGQATTSPEKKETGEEETEPEENESQKSSLSAKEIADKVVDKIRQKEALDNIQPETKVKHTEAATMEGINIKQMNEAIEGGLHIKENLRKYAMVSEEALYESPSVKEAIEDVQRYGQRQLHSNIRVKCVDKGLQIFGNVQVKSTLGATPAENSSSYTQDDVEFADVFAPGIIDTFNNQTNLFGFLKKESHPAGAGSYYQWKMVTNQDPDSNETFVGQNEVSVTKNYAGKNNYQTPLKIARRGVSVTDFIQRYSARSLGDLFRMELDIQMKKMMNDVDAALFAEVADGTGNAPLGLEAVADSAGNTTLYGYTRSTANRLSPDTASDTYEAIGGSLTEAKLRSKITYLRSEGSMLDDLAIVAHPTTYGYLLNLLDGNRRFMTTGATFGFNQKMVAQFDGLPIIVDHNCNSDALCIIDSSQDACSIVIGQEPRITNLAKVGAATEAYIQMDFAFVYKQPRRISMLDTLSGPSS